MFLEAFYLFWLICLHHNLEGSLESWNMTPLVNATGVFKLYGFGKSYPDSL